MLLAMRGDPLLRNRGEVLATDLLLDKDSWNAGRALRLVEAHCRRLTGLWMLCGGADVAY